MAEIYLDYESSEPQNNIDNTLSVGMIIQRETLKSLCILSKTANQKRNSITSLIVHF